MNRDKASIVSRSDSVDIASALGIPLPGRRNSSFAQRAILNRYFLFPFSPDASRKGQILLEIRTKGTLQVPMALWNTQAFFEHASVEEQLHSVYYGILISVIFFNLL